MAQPTNNAPSRAQQAQNQIATRPGAISPAEYEQKMTQWWKDNGRRMISLSGNEEEAKHIYVTAMNVISKNPKLLDCDSKTLFQCLLTSAEAKLLPGYMQECAYVPMEVKGRLEAQFWTMYQGIVKHCWNSGQIKSISADVVYSEDEFDYQKGTNAFLIHKPKIASLSERGKRICAYVAFVSRHGETQFEIVSMDFCEYIKSKSPGGKSSFSPWSNGEYNFNAMCKKTAAKQGAKWIPKTRELAMAIELDQEGKPEQPKSFFTFGGLSAGLMPQDDDDQQPEPQKQLEQTTQTTQTVDATATVVTDKQPETAKVETKEERDARLLGK